MAMVWWILTYLDNYRLQTSLDVLAETNLQAHLFMKWSKTKPSRRPVYKRVRGINIWCGYEYIWDTPNLVEQTQPGNTFEHLFGPIPLDPWDHVWYYLFSIGQRPYKECQSPLIHVPPLELPMASARIYHSANQNIPGMVPTAVTFDSVLWDDAFFYDPANPTKLNISLGGLYAIGASTHWLLVAPAGIRIRIHLNGALSIAGHSRYNPAGGWADTDISLSTLYRFQPGDFIQLIAYNTNPAARVLEATPNYSPHFWINLVGAYPT